MQVRPYLSVIIPAFNEERRIGDSLSRVRAHLAPPSAPCEVLVVDDGSHDRTAAIVERIAAATTPGPGAAVTLRLLRNGRNRGKGYSLKHGVLAARGDFLLLSDADFSTPIEELERLLRPVESGECAIAIGSRGLAASRIERRQPLWRELMGRCFNLLVRAITGLPYRDTQCGFKVMRREAVLPLFRAARVERFAYDVEILYLARKAGVKVLEVPVLWRDSPASKVHALFDSVDMLKDIVGVVARDRRGRYGLPPGRAAAR
ncbi:MAG: dolichyl-phosphate beta-glucosyltransferase [Acidobacteriota bacterium]